MFTKTKQYQSFFFCCLIRIRQIIFNLFYLFSSLDDPYYSGLRARVPNFAKERTRRVSRVNEDTYVSSSRNLNRVPREPVPKRRSIANLDRHQPTFSSLNQINDPRSSLYQRLHHHSYNLPSSQPRSLWHARSYESGIGKQLQLMNNENQTILITFCHIRFRIR